MLRRCSDVVVVSFDVAIIRNDGSPTALLVHRSVGEPIREHQLCDLTRLSKMTKQADIKLAYMGWPRSPPSARCMYSLLQTWLSTEGVRHDFASLCERLLISIIDDLDSQVL